MQITTRARMLYQERTHNLHYNYRLMGCKQKVNNVHRLRAEIKLCRNKHFESATNAKRILNVDADGYEIPIEN